ncbi:MAG TPA: ABC transporter permease [Terriglobales bacterium]|nr:ABC transporter permease [Terriglobales bacterium]
MSGFLDRLAVILRRDLLTAVRYRSASGMYVGGMLAELAAFYYLARAVGPGFRPDGVDYFPFLLLGTGFYGFFVAGVASFVNSIHDAQLTGTMEVLMTTSTPEPELVFLTAVSAFFTRTLHLAFYVAVGMVVFRVELTHPNVVGALAVFVLSMGIAVAAGIAIAAVQVAIQRGSGIVWLMGSLLWLLTGTTFPVSALPGPLRRLAEIIPITHSLDGLRLALLRGADLGTLARSLAILAGWVIVLLPASIWLFGRALRYARREGSLSYY